MLTLKATNKNGTVNIKAIDMIKSNDLDIKNLNNLCIKMINLIFILDALL